MNDYHLTENFNFNYKYTLTSERCGNVIGLFPKANLSVKIKNLDELKRIQNIPLKRFCEILSINTDDNFHTENIVLLAFRYGDEFHRKLSILIIKYHEIDKCMKNGNIRDSLFEDLREIIQKKFGSEEFTRIIDSL